LAASVANPEMVTPAIPGCEHDTPGEASGFSFDQLVEGVAKQVEPYGRPLVLVGFSFGSLIAMRLASVAGWEIKAMVLIDPMVLPLLEFMGYPEEYKEIRHVLEEFAAGTDTGRPDAAAGVMDAWLGPGSYAAMSPRAKDHFRLWGPVAASHLKATLNDTFDRSTFAGIDSPTVATHGSAAPPI
jgi:pimeloyl-ACP methyl ester carboxylesterase